MIIGGRNSGGKFTLNWLSFNVEKTDAETSTWMRRVAERRYRSLGK